MDLAQWGILVFGASAIWLVGRREEWRRWGFIMGLLSQPFWLYTAWTNEQWGVLALSMWYAYAWGQGIWNFWIRPQVVNKTSTLEQEGRR